MEQGSPPPPPPPARAASTTNPVTLFNKYQRGRLLGSGSFAKVHAARCLSDKKLVAIKIIDKARTEAWMEPRIISEIAAMHRLQHHLNILKIHEVMASKTKIYIVMEIALAGDLYSRVLERGKVKETTARRYFKQLVSALQFCHKNGVTHRDVKPQNLLLDEKGNLKVSDFGLSTLTEAKDAAMLHTACGTPGYTAPEVVSRRGYDGPKADAWSCGVVLYFLLSGCLPFGYSNSANTYRRIRRREYDMPSDISKAAKSIINQLLDPNPDTRLSIDALMNHAWFKKQFALPTQSSLFESDSYSKSGKLFDSSESSVNAFDIISLSSGLDLSGLFEVKNTRVKRFTSRKTVERVKERVKEVGARLGYRVEEGKSGVIGLGKGKVVLVFETMEITETVLVVEAKVVEGGGVEFEEGHWGELKDGLEDVLLAIG